MTNHKPPRRTMAQVRRDDIAAGVRYIYYRAKPPAAAALQALCDARAAAGMDSSTTATLDAAVAGELARNRPQFLTKETAMNAYYIRKANKIFPIYGVSSLTEAQEFIPAEDRRYIVETAESVFMNPATGSVGFESDWEDKDLDDLVEVRYSADEETWVAA